MLSSKMKKVLCIALVLLIVGSFGACALQSNFFSVRVQDFTIPTDNQQYLHGTMYIPRSASAENKTPVVISAHGWGDSAEKHDAIGIELSRRGVTVITMDAYSHGLSSNTDDIVIAQAGMDGLGMTALIKYIRSGILDYVDLDRIGIFGHSMGGSIIGGTLAGFGAAYNEALAQAQLPESDGGEEITAAEQLAIDDSYPVHSAFVMGNMDETVTMCFDTLHCNLAVQIGSVEEKTVDEYNNYMQMEHKEGFYGFPYAMQLVKTIDPDITDVLPNTYYGDKADSTLRVYYETPSIHASTMILPWSLAKVMEFFNYTFELPTTLADTNQLHLAKRLCNLTAMVGLLLFLLPLVAIIVETPAFAAIKGSPAKAQPALSGSRKKWFWTGVGINTAVITLLVYLTHRCYNSSWFLTVFPAHLFLSNPTFSVNNLNVFVAWTVLNVIWSIIWALISFRMDKEHNLNVKDVLGLNVSGKTFIKTLAMSVCIVAIFYGIVYFVKWLLGTDFRFYLAAIKPFKPSHLYTVMFYFPVFLLGQLGSAVFTNGLMRFEGMSDRKSLLISILVGITGIVLVNIVQYAGLFITGAITLSGDWMPPHVLMNSAWLLAISPIYHRFCYKLTGKNLLGAVSFSLLFTIIGVANTCISSPLF